MYRSSYTEDRINRYAELVQAESDKGHNPWRVFDNTAASAATSNALSLMAKLQKGRSERSSPVV